VRITQDLQQSVAEVSSKPRCNDFLDGRDRGVSKKHPKKKKGKLYKAVVELVENSSD
jgi:hypothetical protein